MYMGEVLRYGYDLEKLEIEGLSEVFPSVPHKQTVRKSKKNEPQISIQSLELRSVKLIWLLATSNIPALALLVDRSDPDFDALDG